MSGHDHGRRSPASGAELPVTGVSELVLEVADLDRAEEFYADVLGLPIVERWQDRRAVWVMAGTRTRIGLWLRQRGLHGSRGGAHVHFALHLPPAELDAAVARLREAGVAPRLHAFSDSRAAFVDDPDGHLVELWTRDLAAYRAARLAPVLTSEASVSDRLDAASHAWDASYDERTVRAHWWRTRAARVVELAGPPRDGAALDVGCGSGRITEALLGEGWRTSAIDVAPTMVELARARAPGAEIVVGTAEQLPHPDEAFQLVVAVGVLEYTQTEAALREIRRVLTPGGTAILGLRNDGTPVGAWNQRIMVPLARRVKARVPFGRALPASRRPALSVARARALVESAGLHVESVEHVGCAVLPDPVDRFLPGIAYRSARAAERSALLRRTLGRQRLVVARKS